jgi:hypothetical protein
MGGRRVLCAPDPTTILITIRPCCHGRARCLTHTLLLWAWKAQLVVEPLLVGSVVTLDTARGFWVSMMGGI